MPHLKSWASSDNISLLPGGRRPRQSTALLAANTRAQSELDAELEAGQDARGQVLRALRLQQQRDPVTLATEACISLRQLFQLETGASSLFYSPGLRNQAGRRVATLLGADWDRLPDSPPMPVADRHLKLVPAPGTSTSTPAAPLSHASPAQPTHTGSAVLDKPATDTLVLEAHATARLTQPAQSTAGPRRRITRTPAVWLLAGLATGGMGLLLATSLPGLHLF